MSHSEFEVILLIRKFLLFIWNSNLSESYILPGNASPVKNQGSHYWEVGEKNKYWGQPAVSALGACMKVCFTE